MKLEIIFWRQPGNCYLMFALVGTHAYCSSSEYIFLEDLAIYFAYPSSNSGFSEIRRLRRAFVLPTPHKPHSTTFYSYFMICERNVALCEELFWMDMKTPQLVMSFQQLPHADATSSDCYEAIAYGGPLDPSETQAIIGNGTVTLYPPSQNVALIDRQLKILVFSRAALVPHHWPDDIKWLIMQFVGDGDNRAFAPVYSSRACPSIEEWMTPDWVTRIRCRKCGKVSNIQVHPHVYCTSCWHEYDIPICYLSSSHMHALATRPYRRYTSPDNMRIHYTTRGFVPHASLGDRVFDTTLQARDCFGVSAALLRQITASAPTAMQGKIADYIENILLLIGTLSGCSTPVSAVCAVTTYVKTHFKKSIVGMVCDYMHTFAITPQTDGVSFAETIAILRSNWRALVKSAFFGHVSKLLGIIVLSGLCEASSVTMEIRNIKILEPDLMQHHHNAFDLMDAVMGTISYFVENTYASWKTRSLQPLLFGNDFAGVLTADYNRAITWWALVKNGNLERQEGKSDTDFMDLLLSVGKRLVQLAQESSGIDKSLIERKVLEIAKITSDFVVMKLGSRMRKSPFVIQLVGPSNQGKSSIMDQIIIPLLVSAGLDTDPRRRGTVNANEQYMSTWLSNMNVLILDDFAQDKAETTNTNPCRMLLDICNNAIYIANKAEVDQKGKVFVEPDVVFITTNVMDLNANSYVMCPYAIQRRPNVVLEVEVRAQFQSYSNDGIPLGLDPALVSEHYERIGVIDRPEIEDLWLFNMYRAVTPAEKHHVAQYEPVVENGVYLNGLSLPVLVPILIDKFTKHRENQVKLLANSRKKTNLTRCDIEGCVQMKGYCPRHSPVKFKPGVVGVDSTCSLIPEGPDYDDDASQSTFGKDHIAIDNGKRRQETIEFETADQAAFEPHFGDAFCRALSTSGSIIKEKVCKEGLGIMTNLDVGAAAITLQGARYFCWHTRWLQAVPTPWARAPWFRNLYMVMNYTRMQKIWIRSSLSILALNVAGAWYAQKRCPKIMPLTVGASVGLSTVVLSSMTRLVKGAMVRELDSKNAVSDAVREWRDTHGANICKGAAFVAALYGAVKVYNYFRQGTGEPQPVEEIRHVAPVVAEVESEPTPHGNAIPTPPEEEENVWAKIEQTVPYPDDSSRTVMPTILQQVVDKNVYYAELTSPQGKKYTANILFLTSNVCILPRHYFTISEEFSVVMKGRKADTVGGSFKTVLTKAQSYGVPGKDIALCYSATGGSFRSLRKHLPSSTCRTTVPFRGVYRNDTGVSIEFVGKAVPETVTNNAPDPEYATFRGGYYNPISLVTFPGMCGAPILSERSGSKIMGVHVGGHTGQPAGCYVELLQPEMDAAITHLNAIAGVSVTTQAGDLPQNMLDSKIWVTQPLSQRSPLRYLPEGACLQYHGDCLGKVQPKSSVKRTIISESLGRITGVDNKWGPPQMRPEWKPYQVCLSNMCRPARCFPPDLVMRAVRDYSKNLLQQVAAQPEFAKERPLTEQENVNGVPGKKFIDAMVLKTSAGFPFKGKKSQFIVDMEAVGHRELTPEARDLIADAMEKLRRGDRSFGFAKACTKDEVLPITKKKCRIFYSSAFTIIYLARKYYLPVLRFLQMNPTLAECAVGANCHGPDWEALMTFAEHHGIERIIAGDYSKYDQTLPTQLLIAALKILVSIAARMDYTKDDLQVMEALIGDMVFPMINFNGNVISLVEGGWISGVPMTVHVNGICGSMLMRIAFFSLYPEADEFRPCVHLLTYGDDNIGSVAKGYELFNIKSVSHILGTYGMVYTMPDKESELVEYLPLKDLEFLKRKSTFIEELGVRVGSLDSNSIFKSLHCFVETSKDDRLPAERCGEVIDGALREWFFHGREEYETRLAQMREVADLHELHHHIATLEHTFDDRVREWNTKYNPRSSSGEAAAEVTKEPSSIGYSTGIVMGSQECLLEDDAVVASAIEHSG